MSDKDNTNNPLEDLQKQIQDLLRNPNIKNDLGISSEIKQAEPAIEEPEHKDTQEDDILRKIQEFNLKPKEIRDYLNRFVIRQPEAKKVLSVAICDHYNHVRQCIEKPDLLKQEYNKQNILLLGPTGVGKTYLMRTIARLIGVPFVKADATKFSETGYMGSDVEDLVRDLVKAANGDVELAQYGIVYIDEIDKIAASSNSGGKDVSGRGVQINLLKLMEDSEVNLVNPQDMMSQMQAMFDMGGRSKKKKSDKKTINTRHILFIVSGAFDKLAENIRERVDHNRIGFNTPQSEKAEDTHTYLKQAETADFIKYGFEPEFVGRVPVRVSCEALSTSDLASILVSSEGSILRQYENDFKGYGIKMSMDSTAISEIAARAHDEKTGARGLLTVLEKTFRDFKFELPSTAIKELAVNAETVNNPSNQLLKLKDENKHLLKEVLVKDIERFAESFHNEHSLNISFTEDAKDRLIDFATESDKTIRAVCQKTFKDFEHGLKIISRNSNLDTFEISAAVIENPDKELSKWVVASFKEAEEKAQPVETN